jgi:hypothetical protein
MRMFRFFYLQKLRYTANDIDPAYYPARDPYTGHFKQILLQWGYIYSFELSWPDFPNSYFHKFTLTENWDGGVYIYEHTFHLQNVMPTQDSCTHIAWCVLLACIMLSTDANPFHDKHPCSSAQYTSDMCLDLNNRKPSLKILTFNLWNVNSVENTHSAYKTRLEQFAHVSMEALSISYAFHFPMLSDVSEKSR